MARERIAVGLRQRGRPADVIAAGAHRLHEIPQCQHSAYRVWRIALTAGIECIRTLGDDVCRKRNVGRDDEVARQHVLHDLRIGDVESGCNLQHPQVGKTRHPQHLVRDQRHRNPGPLSRPEKYLLDDIRTGICIDPDTRSCHCQPFPR